jgi:hypothetical protein
MTVGLLEGGKGGDDEVGRERAVGKGGLVVVDERKEELISKVALKGGFGFFGGSRAEGVFLGFDEIGEGGVDEGNELTR